MFALCAPARVPTHCGSQEAIGDDVHGKTFCIAMEPAVAGPTRGGAAVDNCVESAPATTARGGTTTLAAAKRIEHVPLMAPPTHSQAVFPFPGSAVVVRPCGPPPPRLLLGLREGHLVREISVTKPAGPPHRTMQSAFRKEDRGDAVAKPSFWRTRLLT